MPSSSWIARSPGIILSVLVHVVVLLAVPIPEPSPEQQTDVVVELQQSSRESRANQPPDPARTTRSTPETTKSTRHQPRSPSPRKSPRVRAGAPDLNDPQPDPPPQHRPEKTPDASTPDVRTAPRRSTRSNPPPAYTPPVDGAQLSSPVMTNTGRAERVETDRPVRVRPERPAEQRGPSAVRVSSDPSPSPTRSRIHEPERTRGTPQPRHRSPTRRGQVNPRSSPTDPSPTESRKPPSAPSVKLTRSTDLSREGSRPSAHPVRPDTGSKTLRPAPAPSTTPAEVPSRSGNPPASPVTPPDESPDPTPSRVASRRSSPSEGNPSPENTPPVLDPSLSTPSPPRRARKESIREFQRSVRSRIEESKTYPRSLREDRIEGTVGIQFTIHPEGTVSSVHCTECSPSKRLNRAAFRAIKRAAPFPNVPSERPLTYRIRLKYRLR